MSKPYERRLTRTLKKAFRRAAKNRETIELRGTPSASQFKLLVESVGKAFGVAMISGVDWMTRDQVSVYVYCKPSHSIATPKALTRINVFEEVAFPDFRTFRIIRHHEW